MVFHCQADPMFRGNIRCLAKPLGKDFELWLMRRETEHETATDNAHNICADLPCMLDMGNHFSLGLRVSACFQSIRMSPGINAVEFEFIELPSQIFKIFGAEFRKETGLERNAITTQSLGPRSEERSV